MNFGHMKSPALDSSACHCYICLVIPVLNTNLSSSSREKVKVATRHYHINTILSKSPTPNNRCVDSNVVDSGLGYSYPRFRTLQTAT